ERQPHPHAEPPALAHRVVSEAAMGTDAPAAGVEDRAGPGTLRYRLLEEGTQLATGHEADLLALGLGSGPQPERGGDLTALRLGRGSEGKVGEGERGLVQHVERVALVLGTVAGAEQAAPPRLAFHTGVVARGEGLGPHGPGPPGEGRELDGPVAGDARVGRL